MLERRRARHQALHILYQRELTEQSAVRILADSTFSIEDGEPAEYCREAVVGVEAHLERIDSIIEDISQNWVVSRMPIVDRNILRLAAWEMLYRDEDVPDSVAINEAIEMAKVYGTDDSSKFINGILGRLADVVAAGGLKESIDE